MKDRTLAREELPTDAPPLAPKEAAQVEKREAVAPRVVHEVIRRLGEEELARPTAALAWSGLAAGLSMGFSMVAEGLLASHLPDTSWRPLIAKFGYSLGFLIVILGRQQLFTENTLTPIIPLLHSRRFALLGQVLRLWGTVLLTNLLGALIFAWLAASTAVFSPEVRAAFTEIGLAASAPGAGTLLLRGVFAGWLIALMVWLLASARGSQVPVIVIITFVVGLGEFSHIIAGSVEVLYVVITGARTASDYLLGFMLPTLAGNILGGVALVAALNHAQVVAGDDRQEVSS